MERDDDVQFGFKSDYNQKESRLRKDPITGAIYAAHGHEPAPARRFVKFSDEYYDPYEERNRRAIPFLRQEIEDFERVSSERFQSDDFSSSAYSAKSIEEGKQIQIQLSQEGREKKDDAEDDAFCYFSAPLRKFLRAHYYVLAITTILEPEIVRLNRGFFIKRTEEDVKLLVSKRGAVFLKRHSRKDEVVLEFQFSEIFEEDLVKQPSLTDEFMNLNERTVTSFIESRMFLRILLRKEDQGTLYVIEKYFFTLA